MAETLQELSKQLHLVVYLSLLSRLCTSDGYSIWARSIVRPRFVTGDSINFNGQRSLNLASFARIALTSMFLLTQQ